MNLPKRNSADGRCYWMKPEVQEELQPLFDQCIQDTIDGRITRLDSLWPPVVVSSCLLYTSQSPRGVQIASAKEYKQIAVF